MPEIVIQNGAFRMVIRRKGIVDALKDALVRQCPIEIERGSRGWRNWAGGYVMGVTDNWVVLQSLAQSVYLDGIEVLRIADITSVEDDTEAGYIERAVAGLGGRPQTDFQLDEKAGTKDVLVAIAARSKLIGVEMEALSDSPRLFGRLSSLSPRKFELQLINPRGVWSPEPSRWWYKDVTSLSFGSRYQTALERFGDQGFTQPL